MSEAVTNANPHASKEQQRIATSVLSKKLLIVEDNVINRQILCKILGDEYETIEAENGQDALDKLEQYGEEITLILLDIVMPVMDGFTFLGIVKEHPLYSTIPVIVTTSNNSEEGEVKSLASGATDFIRKPYRPQIVKHRVDGIINLRETAAMVNMMKYDQLTGLLSKEFFTSARRRSFAKIRISNMTSFAVTSKISAS